MLSLLLLLSTPKDVPTRWEGATWEIHQPLCICLLTPSINVARWLQELVARPEEVAVLSGSRAGSEISAQSSWNRLLFLECGCPLREECPLPKS